MRYLFLLFLSAATLLLNAEAVLEVMPGKSDSLYRTGETIRFRYLLTDNGKAVADTRLRYKIEQENFVPPQTGTLTTDADGRAELSLKAGKPGFVRVSATAVDASGKPLQHYNPHAKKMEAATVRIGAGVEVDQIRFSIAEPADFDRFWADAKRELAAVPLKVLEKEPLPCKVADIKCFDVKIACAGARPVSGILTIPTAAPKHGCPAILSLHGAGIRSATPRTDLTQKYQAIVFDINVHGILNRQPGEYYKSLKNGELKEYIYFPATQSYRENYFKYVFLRALRALEYLRSLPEWDGKVLVTVGGSQGGAQSLAAAGLDEKVTLCVATIPWLTAPNAQLEGRFQPSWPQLLKQDKAGKLLQPDAVTNLKYFDNAYLAKRIKGECVIGYGMIDTICPPSGVLITYNNIVAPKQITGFPTRGHEHIPLKDPIQTHINAKK